MSEIKLRANVRISELVRELETNERARTDLRPSGGRGLAANLTLQLPFEVRA